MIFYNSAIEAQMQRLFASLSEKDKRRYTGIEACKLGRGSIDYISPLFNIDPKTIRCGQQELNPTMLWHWQECEKKGGGAKQRLSSSFTNVTNLYRVSYIFDRD